MALTKLSIDGSTNIVFISLLRAHLKATNTTNTTTKTHTTFNVEILMTS